MGMANNASFIAVAVACHEVLTSLTHDGWLHLFALDDQHGEVLAYRGGQWVTA